MTAMAIETTTPTGFAAAARLAARWAAVGLCAAVLAACQSSRPPQQAGPTALPQSGPSFAAPTQLLADAFGDGITTVAILVPLSGPDSAIGQQLVNAAQLAAVERGGPNFVLLSKDTQGTPSGAAAAAQQAIQERADIIIGPLRAQNLQAVQPIAAQAGINVVSFTSTAAVAGPNAFVLGLTPENEVERIAAYAARQGASVLAILAPQSEYGSVATRAMQSAAPRNGLAIGPIQVYNPTDADHTSAVRSLEAGGFDTLFVPDGGGSLARVMPFVAYYNVNRGRRVIGTGLWLDRATFGDPSTNGGAFASIDPVARDAFFAKYQGAYGSQPSVVAGLAYNAAAMAAALGQANDFSANAIANPNGFAGVYGAYRLGQDYVADHALSVLQVNSGRFDVVDPAPTSFVGF